MRRALSVGLLIFASCQSMSMLGRRPLDGAWEFVSARYTNAAGKTSEHSAADIRSLKVLADGRFSFITVKNDGTFIRAAGGRYTISNDQYSEIVEQTSGSPELGTYAFTWHVDGDRWHNTGSHQGIQFDEVWRRVR
jgi:hypothetical protein